jgi:hypothetical protein
MTVKKRSPGWNAVGLRNRQKNLGKLKCAPALSQQKPAGLLQTGGPEASCYCIIARA